MSDITVTFTVPKQDALRTGRLYLSGEAQNFTITLSAPRGTDRFHYESSKFPIGQLRMTTDEEISAWLNFRYWYYPAFKGVIVCDTDYPSVWGMTLMSSLDHTMPEKEFSEHAAASGYLIEEKYNHLDWNYHSQGMPGAATYFKKFARAANVALIEALQKQSLRILVNRLMPQLDSATYRRLCFLMDGDPENRGKLYEYTTKDDEYLEKERYLIFPESYYGGTLDWPSDMEFINVKGTELNPLPPSSDNGMSWLELWKRAYDDAVPASCAAKDYNSDIKCSDKLVAGHIVEKGRPEIPRLKDAFNIVHVLPLCVEHDKAHVVMKITSGDPRAIWFDNRWALKDFQRDP